MKLLAKKSAVYTQQKPIKGHPGKTALNNIQFEAGKTYDFDSSNVALIRAICNAGIAVPVVELPIVTAEKRLSPEESRERFVSDTHIVYEVMGIKLAKTRKRRSAA